MDRLRILILENEPFVSQGLQDFILREGLVSYSCSSSGQAWEAIKRHSIDIMIVDMAIRGNHTERFIQKVKSEYPETDILAISRKEDISKKDALAGDILSARFTHPFYWKEVERAIRKTVSFYRIQGYKDRLELNFARAQELLVQRGCPVFCGGSTAIKQIADLMMHVSGSADTSVLITGECGTGKEQVARGIHALTHQGMSGFVAVNCAAVPAGMFEIEFFGGELKPGEKTTGWFEMANHGTLFLKGINDLSFEMQTKLIGVLDHRNLTLLGSHREIPLEQRIIASLNSDLSSAMSDHKLRYDLINRINAFHIQIPPLRERKEDIPELLRHFMERYSQKLNKPVKHIDNRVLDQLISYPFPGNILELRNMVERAVILTKNNTLRVEHFEIPESAGGGEDENQNLSSSGFNLDDSERSTIIKALHASNNNKAKASRLLNISRQALDRKIARLKIRI